MGVVFQDTRLPQVIFLKRFPLLSLLNQSYFLFCIFLTEEGWLTYLDRYDNVRYKVIGSEIERFIPIPVQNKLKKKKLLDIRFISWQKHHFPVGTSFLGEYKLVFSNSLKTRIAVWQLFIFLFHFKDFRDHCFPENQFPGI